MCTSTSAELAIYQTVTVMEADSAPAPGEVEPMRTATPKSEMAGKAVVSAAD